MASAKSAESHPSPLLVYDSNHQRLPGSPSPLLTPFNFGSVSTELNTSDAFQTARSFGVSAPETSEVDKIKIAANSNLFLTEHYDTLRRMEKVLILAKVCGIELAEHSIRKAFALFSGTFNSETAKDVGDPKKLAADILVGNDAGVIVAAVVVAVLDGNKNVYDALVQGFPDSSFRSLAFRLLFLFRIPRETFFRFLTGFEPENVFKFEDLLLNVAALQCFEHLETHLRIQEAFLLIGITHELITLALNEKLRCQQSCASILFHALCRSLDYSDADLTRLLEPFLENGQFGGTDLLSMLISASHFRPKLVPRLYDNCLAHKPVSNVVPQLSFKHQEVITFICSRIRTYNDSDLYEMITFAHQNNLPRVYLIYFLSLKIKIEDYLVELILENRSYLVAGQMDLISSLDLPYIEAKLALHMESISFDDIMPVLMICAESPIIFQLPILMLPRVLSEKLHLNPEDRDQLADVQNDIVCKVLSSFDGESMDPKTAHRIRVNLISYASNAAELFEFMASRSMVKEAAELAQVVAVESNMRAVSFESVQKRIITVSEDNDFGIHLRIISHTGEEHLVIL